jgi:hypothetical protein
MLEEQGKIKEEDKIPPIGEEEVYLSAFSDLSTERFYGMDIGPIPFSKILQYKQHFDLSEDFVEIIMLIDREYLLKREKKRNKK